MKVSLYAGTFPVCCQRGRAMAANDNGGLSRSLRPMTVPVST
jgi:hypothetical protein